MMSDLYDKMFLAELLRRDKDGKSTNTGMGMAIRTGIAASICNTFLGIMKVVVGGFLLYLILSIGCGS